MVNCCVFNFAFVVSFETNGLKSEALNACKYKCTLNVQDRQEEAVPRQGAGFEGNL